MDIEKSNHDKIQAQIAKLLAETDNISKKTKWYEVVLIMSFTATLLAVGKYLL